MDLDATQVIPRVPAAAIAPPETPQSRRYYDDPLTWHWWGMVSIVSLVAFLWVLLAIELHFL